MRSPGTRVAVLALQRLGDVITAARVTQAWSQRKDVATVEVVHWDRTRDAAQMLPGVTQTHALPYAALRARRRVHPLAAYAALHEIVESMGRFDRVVNLSSTRFASLLAPALCSHPEAVFGPQLDDYGTYQASHPALEHLNAWGVDPAINVFAHQDLYAQAARIRMNGYAGLPEDAIADNLCAHARSDERAAPIALHLHGSVASKDWREPMSPSGWRGIVETLRARFDRPILLLGGPKERQHLEALATASGAEVAVWPLRHTAALLRRCCGLISVDTVAIHLAAQVACPTLVLRQGATRGFAFVPGSSALLVDAGDEPANVDDVVWLAGKHFFGLAIHPRAKDEMATRIRVRQAELDSQGFLGAASPSWWPATDAQRQRDLRDRLWRNAWLHSWHHTTAPHALLHELRCHAPADGHRFARAMADRGQLGKWLRAHEDVRHAA